MPYRTSIPGALTTVEDLRGWTEGEFQALEQGLEDIILIPLQITYVPPDKPRELMIVAADGISWNPGSGRGLYVYLSGAWRGVYTRFTRNELLANTTYYVNTGGSNFNDGLTPGTAVQTIQRAWDIIQNNVDLAGHDVTIQCAASQTFTNSLVMGVGFFDSFAQQSSAGRVTLDLGAGTLSPSGGFLNTDCITAAGPVKITVKNGTLVSSSGNCLAASFGATITVGPNITFGAANGNHMSAQYGGIIRGADAYSITGGAQAHYYADADGFIIFLFSAVTLTGSLTFSQGFCVAQSLGNVHLGSVTFSGGTITGKRYAIVGSGGGINFEDSANQTYFPGNAHGTVVAGAQYDSNFPLGGAGVALTTTAVDGFWYIPTCPGAPTGVPTTITGCAPMVYDTTNNKFWMYNGAWRGVVLT